MIYRMILYDTYIERKEPAAACHGFTYCSNPPHGCLNRDQLRWSLLWCGGMNQPRVVIVML